MEIITAEKALIKLYKYCAYQERCQQEVREKIFSMGLRKEEVESIIVRLIEENFLNEERFAIAFSGGKFRINQWGRVKIKHALKQHDISEYCIRKAMQVIDMDDYEKLIDVLIKKKNKQLNDSNKLARAKKIQSYMYAKGFEQELVMPKLRVALDL
jgi:regulatory protein